MALKLKQVKGNTPTQFDGLDSEYLTLKGGEVVGLTYVSTTGTDKYAKDNDGYVSNTKKTRPAVTKTLTSGMRPLYLVDDGSVGYGRLFGVVVGGVAGQQVTGGTDLGLHSATGSGKITCWDAPGQYAVTLDAVDTDENTGLQPTNTTLSGLSSLYATSAGLLTPNVSKAFESVVVAKFLEFTTNGSYVTTPTTLAVALNSPLSDSTSGTVKKFFSEVLIHFAPGQLA